MTNIGAAALRRPLLPRRVEWRVARLGDDGRVGRPRHHVGVRRLDRPPRHSGTQK